MIDPGELSDLDAADRATAERLAAGDPTALRAAFNRYGGLVHAIALRRLGTPQDAEDVTQQVFVRAWRGRATLDLQRGTLGAWLVGITRRQIADRLASRRRDLELADRVGRMSFGSPPAPAPQVTLHRAEWQPGERGDLLVGQIVEERQPHHRADLVG